MNKDINIGDIVTWENAYKTKKYYGKVISLVPAYTPLGYDDFGNIPFSRKKYQTTRNYDRVVVSVSKTEYKNPSLYSPAIDMVERVIEDSGEEEKSIEVGDIVSWKNFLGTKKYTGEVIMLVSANTSLADVDFGNIPPSRIKFQQIEDFDRLVVAVSCVEDKNESIYAPEVTDVAIEQAKNKVTIPISQFVLIVDHNCIWCETEIELMDEIEKYKKLGERVRAIEIVKYREINLKE